MTVSASKNGPNHRVAKAADMLKLPGSTTGGFKMFYIQLFGDAFEGDSKSFDLAATRFDSIENAITGTTALAQQALFPFDRAEGFRIVDGAAHLPVHEARFAAAQAA